MKPLKIVVIGDGAVGKTCMLISYTTNEFPKAYVPTIFENHNCNLTVNDKEYQITLWDTAGQEGYEHLRKLSYPNTDCFIVCYSIDNRNSYYNVNSIWVEEIRNHSKGPIVLVATKSDLRVKGSDKYVTVREGHTLKKEIKARAFIECSAVKRENLDKVFEEAARACDPESYQSGCCSNQ